MLIGLHGRKQAGKDTVHQRIERIYDTRAVGVPVERASFADLLYESAATALGLTVDDLQALKSEPAVVLELADYRGHYMRGGQRRRLCTIREYLQRFGTESHRHIFGDNFWVDNLAKNLHTHGGRIVVVTDVRFPNEAEAVRAAGGHVVRVVGPTEVEDAGDGHASEAPLPESLIDDVLFNAVRDDDFDSLDFQVVELVRRLREKE